MSKKRSVKNMVYKITRTKLIKQNRRRLIKLKIKTKILSKDCPCGIDASYKNCCYVAHSNIKNVTTPEQLMRSRYTAYTMANVNYLMLSNHSSTRPSHRKKQILNWTKKVRWHKLEILNNTEDTVEFNAYFYDQGTLKCLHENSKFEKEDGVWKYVNRVR